jgi:hypothetical protein
MGLLSKFSKKATHSEKDESPSQAKKPSLFQRYRDGQPGEGRAIKGGKLDSVNAANLNEASGLQREDDLKKQPTKPNREGCPTETVAPLGEGFGVASAPPSKLGLGKSTVPGGTGLMGYLSR